MNSLEKEFIPYELALELKQLGFDEPCLAWLNSKSKLFADITMGYETTDFLYTQSDMEEKQCVAPTYSQAFIWFRKKGYRFSVIIDSPLAEEESHYIEIWFEKQFLHESHYIYKTYEDAELDLLKKLIGYEKEKQ
jgi:hypothetical protein